MEKSTESQGVESVIHRNLFYWNSYRYMALAVTLLILLNILLLGFIIYQRVTWPTPKYFATTQDGRPLPVVNLALPYYTDTKVIIDWAIQAIQEIYTLDYVTWRKVLQDAEAFFTPKGYRDFLAALKESTNLNAVKADKYVVSVAVTGPSVLSRQGQRSSDVPYSWSLQIPVKVTYQNSANKINTQVGFMQIDIERASLLRYREGIAIAQLVFVQT
jgi:intracellular multiplication protein IcmL